MLFPFNPNNDYSKSKTIFSVAPLIFCPVSVNQSYGSYHRLLLITVQISDFFLIGTDNVKEASVKTLKQMWPKREKETKLKSNKSARRKSPEQSHWAQSIPFSVDPAEWAEIDGVHGRRAREGTGGGGGGRRVAAAVGEPCCSSRAQRLSLSHWFQLNNKLDHFSYCPTVAPLAFLFIPPFSRAACTTCV